jgi:hypothetical protein
MATNNNHSHTNTADGVKSSRDLFRIQTANLTKYITVNLLDVTNELYAKGIISQSIKDEMLVIGIPDPLKASRLVNALDTYLRGHTDADKCLVGICHTLIGICYQPLTDIGNTLLQQLGHQPIIVSSTATVSSNQLVMYIH